MPLRAFLPGRNARSASSSALRRRRRRLLPDLYRPRRPRPIHNHEQQRQQRRSVHQGVLPALDRRWQGPQGAPFRLQRLYPPYPEPHGGPGFPVSQHLLQEDTYFIDVFSPHLGTLPPQLRSTPRRRQCQPCTADVSDRSWP